MGETLIGQGTIGQHLYVVVKGCVITQKKLQIESQNFWPTDYNKWSGAKIYREVDYTSHKMGPGAYFGMD